MRHSHVRALALLSVVLAACGGSIAEDAVPPPSEDASADAAATPEAAEKDTWKSDAGAVPAPADCDHLPSCIDGGCDDAAPEQPVALVTGQTDVTGLASDGANVFWAVNDALGSIVECATTGCNGQPIVFADAQSNPLAIVLDGSTLYWLDGATGAIVGCPSGGCNGAPATVVSGLWNPWNTFGAGAGHAFFAVVGGPFVSCPEGGCAGTPPIVSTVGVLGAVAVGGANVYWRDFQSGDVLACDATACGAPTKLATAQKFGGLAATACGAYWTVPSNGTVLTCPPTGCAEPVVLATNQSSPNAIAADATGVYWAAADGLRTCPLGGCAEPRLLASASGIRAIALDASSVYFATPDSVFRVPK